MLGKLIKHEFKATWMIMTIICAVLLGTGLVAGFTLRSFVSQDDLTDIQFLFLSFAAMFFIIVLVSMALLATVYLVVHYYRSLYTAQGYLSFTLPASITEVVSSRMIVACIWTVVVTLFLGLCIVLVAVIGSNQYMPDILEFFNEAYSDIIDEIGRATFNVMFTQYVLIAILAVISRIMLFFFCISIGQLWEKHKIFGAIIAYFATTFVLGIISTVISVSYFGALSTLSYGYYDAENLIRNQLLRYLIYNVAVTVFFYVGSIVVSNKKLNLD